MCDFVEKTLHISIRLLALVEMYYLKCGGDGVLHLIGTEAGRYPALSSADKVMNVSNEWVMVYAR